MSRFLNRKSIAFVLVTLALIAGVFGGVMSRGGAAQTHAAGTQKIIGAGNNNPFCKTLGKSVQASQGAQIFCFGPQGNNGSTGSQHRSGNGGVGTNVNAANPAEDVSPAGVRAYGQSEVSTAASGSYVVEAWNDATGFFSACGSPMNKEELTGFSFSNNGGKTFTDLGGVPNANCANSRAEGDPSVEVYNVGGSTYFYISSIFIPFNIPENELSVTACKVQGTGSSATLTCGQPIVAAISSDCVGTTPFVFCSFLDKEFLSIDPVHARLYMSYTEFGVSSFAASNGIIELAVCDLSANPASPTCFNGSLGSSGSGQPPYYVVAPADPNCENEGAYPAVDLATGDVYVAYEHNWASAIFSSTCASVPVKNVMNHVPFSCLPLVASAFPTAPCAAQNSNAVNITSLQAAFIPGYNRFPMNDFPRLAVSDPFGTVSMVWNDARSHPAGDILLQSFNLGSLGLVQATPVRINSSTGGWHMLPALRNVDDDGDLQISFYGRTTGNTAITNVYTTIDTSPKTNSTPGNVLVTTAPSDWNAVSSDIVPNFGDYTDNYVKAQAGAPYTTQTLFVAWSDGRLGDPQPFNAHAHTN
jgi:hypothetical protein